MGVNDAIVQEVLYKDTVAQEVLYMNYLSVRPLVLSDTLFLLLRFNSYQFFTVLAHLRLTKPI